MGLLGARSKKNRKVRDTDSEREFEEAERNLYPDIEAPKTAYQRQKAMPDLTECILEMLGVRSRQHFTAKALCGIANKLKGYCYKMNYWAHGKQKVALEEALSNV